MKNLAFKLIGNWLLAAYGVRDPTNEEHSVCIEVLKTRDLSKLRILIHSKGGAPSAAQRKQMNDLVKGHEIPVAVMSTSAASRGVVVALSWFNKNMKSFSPDEAVAALRHLGVPEVQHELFLTEMKKLQVEVGEPVLRSGFGFGGG